MNRTPQRSTERSAQDFPSRADAALGLDHPGQACPSLRVLRRLAPRLQVAALQEALPHALPSERDMLAAALLELALPNPFDSGPAKVPLLMRFRGLLGLGAEGPAAPELARAALVGRWALLTDEIRKVAMTLGSGNWEDPVAAALTSDDPVARRSAAVFVRSSGLGVGVDSLAGLLVDPNPEVAREAELALLGLAAAAADVGGGGDALEQAVAKAAAGFGVHRRLGPVLAALLLADRRTVRRGAAIAAWLEREASLGAGASRGALRTGNPGLFRLRAWELLKDERWAPACRIRIARVETVADHELLLDDWHLGLNPRRAQAAGPLVSGSSDRILPRAGAFSRLSAGARVGAMHMAGELSATAADRAELCGVALGDRDVRVRVVAADAAPMAGVADFAFDPDERVARRAVLRGSAVGEPLPRHARVTDADLAAVHRAGALARSARATVSAWAMQDLARSELHSRLAVAAMAQAGRVSLQAALGELVERAEPQRAMQIIEHVRRAGLTRELAPAIGRRFKDQTEDARLAATCIAALSDAPAQHAWPAIEAALGSTEPRVRANAVEAAAKQMARAQATGDRFGMLIEHKSDPHHRVRANLLRAWILQGPDADVAWERFRSMLGDRDTMSRLAAAWLASRVLPGASVRIGAARWDELVGQIEGVAAGDSEPRVRDRAYALSEQLRGEREALWAPAQHERGTTTPRSAWEEAA